MVVLVVTVVLGVLGSRSHLAIIATSSTKLPK